MSKSKLKSLLTRKQELVEKEIPNLQKRRESVEKQINKIKLTLGTAKEPKDAQTNIRDLVSERNVFDEVIEEKQAELESVKSELEPLELAEENEAKKDQLVKLAKQADASAKKYHEAKAELEEILKKKLNEIMNYKSDWKESATAFNKLADTVEPGFLTASYSKGADSEAAYELIDGLKERTDVSAAMSDHILRRQYFSFLGGQLPYSSKDLIFNFNIKKMMDILADRQYRESQQKGS